MVYGTYISPLTTTWESKKDTSNEVFKNWNQAHNNITVSFQV